jgi:tetratricopeptide (TPR) repeat protein
MSNYNDSEEDMRITQVFWSLLLLTMLVAIGKATADNVTAENPITNVSDPVAWYNKGEDLLSLSKYNESIQAFNKAIELNQSYIEAWNHMGISLFSLGNYNESIKCFNKANEIDPTDKMAREISKIWNQKGQELAELGKYSEAIKAYDEATKINPNETTFWYNKGDAFEALGLYSEAKTAFEKGDANINQDCEYRYKNLIGHINNAKYDYFEGQAHDRNYLSGIFWDRVPELALWTLGEIDDSQVVGPLIRALSENESAIRYEAIHILGDIRDPSAVDPLILALKDNDSEVRASSASALGYIGDPRAVDALIQALKDDDEAVRWCAARALAGIESAQPEVMHALRTLASEDSSEEVRFRAKISLNELQFLNSCID